MGDQSIDLGNGHTLRPSRNEGILYGFHETHPRPDNGQACIGYIPVGHSDEWTLEAEDPITLSPSVLCRICGTHGFIRDGKWVDA